jgi:geranylgeranyl pyrophosphate synthase
MVKANESLEQPMIAPASSSLSLPEILPVEETLRRVLAQDSQRGPIGDAMRYAVFGGAGRIRPILTMRIARIAGSHPCMTARAAAAVELLHCASLIVDDLPCMDNDSERRGRAAVHIRFGEATAVLAAHSLVALSARCLVGPEVPEEFLPAMVRLQIRLLDAMDANGLCGGQQMDLDGSGSNAAVTELKTVPLFRLAVEAGSIGGSRWEQWRFPLRSFAREIGAVYQMTDDYLDGDLTDRCALEKQYFAARACLSPLGESAAEPLLELLESLHARIPSPSDRSHR